MKCFLFLLLLFSGCRKDSGDTSLNCEKFQAALEAHDNTRLKLLLDPISRSAGEISQTPGMQAGSENTRKLIQLLNQSHCNIHVDKVFGIVDTNPAQAEIAVTSTISNHTFHIDFWLVEGRHVEFHRIHE